MTRDLYNIYREMFDLIPSKSEALKNYLENKGCKIISDVYVSVGNEEKRLYFVDVEYIDELKKYHRIYGLKDLEKF